jgi:hypothetical protein
MEHANGAGEQAASSAAAAAMHAYAHVHAITRELVFACFSLRVGPSGCTVHGHGALLTASDAGGAAVTFSECFEKLFGGKGSQRYGM